MKPSDLIAELFHHAPGQPDADKIAGPEVLQGIADAIREGAATLNSPRLSPAQQEEFRLARYGHRVGTLKLHRAYQRFLVLRPDYADNLRVDPQVYLRVIDKMDAHLGIEYVLQIATQKVADGLLVLDATISRLLGEALDDAARRIADPSTPDAERNLLKVRFIPSFQFLQEQEEKNQRRGKRRARVEGRLANHLAARSPPPLPVAELAPKGQMP